MLARFNRNKKRQSRSSLGGSIFKRPKSSSLSPRDSSWSLIPKDRPFHINNIMSSSIGKVKIDDFCMRAIRIEVESLLRDKNPASVQELTNAVSSSGTVLEMHQSYATSLAGRLQSLSLARTPKGSLKLALNKLASSVNSDTELITNWSEAKEVLQRVLEFPDASQVNDEPKETPSLEEYTNRLKKSRILQALTSRFATGVRPDPFLELGLEPSNAAAAAQGEGADLGEPRDAIERSDQDLAKQIQEMERQRSEQLESEAMRELEQRMEEEQRRREAQEMAASLLRELTDEEQQIVREAMYGIGPSNEVLAQVGTDSVRRESMHRLQPGKWLNDEAIHYFLIMLANRDEKMCREDPSRKRSHFFKSFFMTKLLNEGHDDPNMDGQYEYKNVKRWSKNAPGKDLFNLDKIFFPINEGRSHWICAVVFFKEKRIQMYDSMGADGMHYLKHIFRYLQDEHLAKKGCPMPDIDEWKLVPCTRDTPSQRNGFDCGVFTCMFADFLSKDCPLVFSQEHITQCRERIALSIMQGSAIM